MVLGSGMTGYSSGGCGQGRIWRPRSRIRCTPSGKFWDGRSLGWRIIPPAACMMPWNCSCGHFSRRLRIWGHTKAASNAKRQQSRTHSMEVRRPGMTTDCLSGPCGAFPAGFRAWKRLLDCRLRLRWDGWSICRLAPKGPSRNRNPTLIRPEGLLWNAPPATPGQSRNQGVDPVVFHF